MTGRIVFDLDGTLIDSAPDIREIANGILAEEGREPVTLAEVRGFIGNGAGVFVQRLRAARSLPDAAQDDLLHRFTARYEAAVELTRPYPGVIAALTDLRDKGHALGLCTNKPMRPCMAVLRHLHLAGFFDTVWAGDSLPQRKPDPAPLIAAFDALPQGPRLYVGDSEVDAETAKRAEVPFLLFTEGYRKTPVEALPHTASFDHFAALCGHVDRLLADQT